MNEADVERLDELDIPVTVDVYGAGTHTWPYWERGLHEAMPLLEDALAGSTKTYAAANSAEATPRRSRIP
jgi:S-formylglutathione hydrolase FrmB